MDVTGNLPDLADWMMYGGGIAALVGLVMCGVKNRADASSGMAQPLVVLGIVVFVAGLVLAIQEGIVQIGGLP